jgi:hypothetical protein
MQQDSQIREIDTECVSVFGFPMQDDARLEDFGTVGLTIWESIFAVVLICRNGARVVAQSQAPLFIGFIRG